MTADTDDPAVWRGPEMARREDWRYDFSDEDIAEIQTAVASVRDLDIIQVSRDDFSLPRLGAVLRGIQKQLIEGRGFAILRGLPAETWSRRDSAIAYWGIARHFGDPVSQNAQGHLLGHVKDTGEDPENPVTRIYQTSYRQPYHTDSCDIVGLLCLRKSKSGGASRTEGVRS